MGLAASQARLFGITARKADCEFKAMDLAQQKLEITDQLATIANEYSNSLGTTALFWSDAYGDYYGLTYGLLMSPSASNDYNPFFVMTSSGAIVLNSAYAAAAQAAGIPQSGSMYPSQSMRDKFIAALVPIGAITQETANEINVTDYVAKVSETDLSKIVVETDNDSITSDANSIAWRSDAGLGGGIYDKAAYIVKTLYELLDDPNYGGQVVPLPTNISVSSTNIDSTNSNAATLVKNGFITNEGTGITLSDILSNEYIFVSGGGASSAHSKMTQLLKSVAQILGYGQIGKGINTDASSDYALTYAYNMVENVFLNTSTYVHSGNTTDKNIALNNDVVVDAMDNNKICTNGSRFAVNITNMVAAFLSYYDNALMGTSSPYIVSNKAAESILVTLSPDYNYIVAPQKNELMSTSEKLADFYDELLNNICAKGWRADDSIDDFEYLANSLKNGRYSVASLHEDGQYYQVRYNNCGYIEELKDEDAIARAEAEYAQKKAELTYKEDSIDLKTKSLDAEIAQLNQEYETVKNLVSKNIEKSFSMYSN